MLFCQDKEIGVEAMERKRIEYIDWLRIISAIAVIGIHITMTQPNNYSVQEIGKSNYTILTCVYTLIQWAVPVFLMISGNLLLHSNKLAFTKVKKMSLRMGAVLLLFGSAFALLEQVFERKTLEIGMLPNSVLMTLQQKSWSHLWYLYILIGIYLILIPLKRFIDNSSNREICIFTAILIFGNFVIPTINIAFGTKIENYMLFTQYVTYVLLGFVFPVMVNQQYGNAYYQIPILLIAVIFQILVGLYSAIYIALKKSSTIARTTIAGAIINVLVNLALIRFIGLYAASISTLVSYASTALYRRIDIRKYIKIKVNVKNILLNSVAVVFVTLSYYFNITILNVAALVIACIYAVGINWKLIKMFFAEIRKYKKEGN